MNQDNRLSLADRVLVEFDKGLRNLTRETSTTSLPLDAATYNDDSLSEADRLRSAQLMRVNHAGEIAAQALYHAQSITARSGTVKRAMSEAADEEVEHLAWCAQRLDELNSHRSLLDPIWYAGSFAIGALAGMAGDRWSLGFVAETERQVVNHLDKHLQKLPTEDRKSRAILEQMKIDEQKHGESASKAGGEPLPPPLVGLMGVVSKIMTRTARWI
ncbi:MAG: 2-polyprenyl-3-methyl-6-methoxy-1,4-benzoquinone monooxygenase [Pseudomonadota bacterium]